MEYKKSFCSHSNMTYPKLLAVKFIAYRDRSLGELIYKFEILYSVPLG